MRVLAILHTRMLVLSMHPEEAYVTEALHLGVKRYVVESTPIAEIVQEVRVVINGNTYIGSGLSFTPSFAPGTPAEAPQSRFHKLTEREIEALKLVADGRTGKEVGDELVMAERTAEFHRSHILHKLGLKTNGELVVYAVKHHLLPKPR